MYYHVYNRGVEKRNVFEDSFDYLRFLELLDVLNNIETIGSLYEHSFKMKREGEVRLPIGSLTSKKENALVEIVAFCLLPNHYHLLLKEVSEKGISKFMQRLGTGHTKHFNYKYKRNGYLFQGTYKKVKIESDDQLNYVLAYIIANSEIHGISAYREYKYCNYKDFKNQTILNNFSSKEEFTRYLDEVVKNSKEIKKDKKKYMLE